MYTVYFPSILATDFIERYMMESWGRCFLRSRGPTFPSQLLKGAFMATVTELMLTLSSYHVRSNFIEVFNRSNMCLKKAPRKTVPYICSAGVFNVCDRSAIANPSF